IGGAPLESDTRTRAGIISTGGTPLPFRRTASSTTRPLSGRRWMSAMRPSTLVLNSGRPRVGAARLAVRQATRPRPEAAATAPIASLPSGGGRTGLFNWRFPGHHGGKYLLRIEDTDRARSTSPAIDAILEGLSWLGLPWDGEVTYQFARAARHAEVAHQMLAAGQAYHCYASPKELEEMRDAQRRAGAPMRYAGRWRDRNPTHAPPGVAPVFRPQAPP